MKILNGSHSNIDLCFKIQRNGEEEVMHIYNFLKEKLIISVKNNVKIFYWYSKWNFLKLYFGV